MHAKSKSELSPDERARETEQTLTDDERFSLIISLMGAVPLIGQPRDKRIPEDVTNMSAGYTPSIPRLGVPALKSSDASIGDILRAGRRSWHDLTALLRAELVAALPDEAEKIDVLQRHIRRPPYAPGSDRSTWRLRS